MVLHLFDWLPAAIVSLALRMRRTPTSQGVRLCADPTGWSTSYVVRSLRAGLQRDSRRHLRVVGRAIRVAVPPLNSGQLVRTLSIGNLSALDQMRSRLPIDACDEHQLYFLVRLLAAHGASSLSLHLRDELRLRFARGDTRSKVFPAGISSRAQVLSAMELDGSPVRALGGINGQRRLLGAGEIGGIDWMRWFLERLANAPSPSCAPRAPMVLHQLCSGASVAVVGPGILGTAEFADLRDWCSSGQTAVWVKSLPLLSERDSGNRNVVWCRGKDLEVIRRDLSPIRTRGVQAFLVKRGGASGRIGETPVLSAPYRAPIAFGRALGGSDAIVNVLAAGAVGVRLYGFDLYSRRDDYRSDHLPRQRDVVLYRSLTSRQRRALTQMFHDLVGEFHFLTWLRNGALLTVVDRDFDELLTSGEAEFASRLDASND